MEGPEKGLNKMPRDHEEALQKTSRDYTLLFVCCRSKALPLKCLHRAVYEAKSKVSQVCENLVTSSGTIT